MDEIAGEMTIPLDRLSGAAMAVSQASGPSRLELLDEFQTQSDYLTSTVSGIRQACAVALKSAQAGPLKTCVFAAVDVLCRLTPIAVTQARNVAGIQIVSILVKLSQLNCLKTEKKDTSDSPKWYRSLLFRPFLWSIFSLDVWDATDTLTKVCFSFHLSLFLLLFCAWPPLGNSPQAPATYFFLSHSVFKQNNNNNNSVFLHCSLLSWYRNQLTLMDIEVYMYSPLIVTRSLGLGKLPLYNRIVVARGQRNKSPQSKNEIWDFRMYSLQAEPP